MVWFWFWLTFIVLLVLLPLSYGWGYRRWGAPYPRMFRTRRGPQGGTVHEFDPDATSPSAEDPTRRGTVTEPDPYAPPGTGWGWFADALWILVIIGVIWLIVALV